jgi:hypothetical protein
MTMHRSLFYILSALILLAFASAAGAQADDCTDDCTEVAEARPEHGLSAEEIAAIELPDFEQHRVDQDLLHDRSYAQVTENIAIHDAPGGNHIRTIDAGFNFFTIRSVQDGWVEINPGEWISSANVSFTNHIVSEFTGIFLPDEGLEYTPAWLLVNLYPSAEPGGNPVESNGLMYRYTLVTIFDTVKIGDWNWYQIGPEQWVMQTHVSKVVPIDRPEDVTTEKWFALDLYEQNIVLYEGDQPIFATLVSTGLPRWPTYEGTFNIYYRRAREAMSWGTPGDDFYYLEEVPWTMYFDEGRALHGAYWHDGFGYRRSHGCVNLPITDANWIYQWVAEDFDKLNSPDVEEGPAVHVYSTGVYR